MKVFNPHAYQRRAIEWVEARDRSALFLDMGLGKTVITLSAISDMIEAGEVSRVLVVAPKKVAESTWSDEASKWQHTSWLRVVPVIGDAPHRIAALRREAEINVIGRDSLVWLWEQYTPSTWPFDMVVLDELSSFKNPQSKRFSALKKIAKLPGRMIGLTGTPAPNGMEDLWAQIWPLDKGERLGKTLTAYRLNYFNAYTLGGVCTKYSIKPGADKLIHEKLSDICLSMIASDYLSLPPRMEIDVNVALSPRENDAYRSFEHDMVLDLGDAEVTAQSAAALMNKLSQYTSGAVYSNSPYNTEWCATTQAKIEALAEIVEAAPGPVLVFYQWKHEVPRIRTALRGVKVKEYAGPTTLNEWNRRQIDVLLAHPASMAYGLNMQNGGSTMVWTGTGWNLELYQQACARLHRQGQIEPVRIYRLICPGTVDALAAKALSRKDGEQTALLQALSKIRRRHLQDCG